MFKGTYEGNISEIAFVSKFNSNKKLFKTYLNNFDNNNLWLVRITTKQISKLNNKKVFTRSDCYLANINENINEILMSNNYYLSEEILDSYKIKYDKIPYSGISIKMASSTNYQIIKMTPNSFNYFFNSYELGAGASLFCNNQDELIKNIELISGWKTNISYMCKYFYNFTQNNELFYLNKDICNSIKKHCISIISNDIYNSIELQSKIFNGIDVYEEPYTAHYFYQESNIFPLSIIPFNVTTGSGRSKGNYSIVLKPKK
ncbi:MAG: hypothetical protein R3Y64_08700 [Peptostreptococcaceae bacterium]